MTYKTLAQLEALIDALEAEIPLLLLDASSTVRQRIWTNYAKVILAEASAEDFDYVFGRLEAMLHKYDIFIDGTGA